jgi:hypothetical protein
LLALITGQGLARWRNSRKPRGEEDTTSHERQKDEKSCTLTAPEYSMYLRPTLELLQLLVDARNALPILASQSSHISHS